MKKIIRLTESDLIRIVRKVIREEEEEYSYDIQSMDCGVDDKQQYHWDGKDNSVFEKMRGSVEIDDETDTIVIRYCKGLEKVIPRLKHQGKMKLKQKYEGVDFSDDDTDNLDMMRRHFG